MYFNSEQPEFTGAANPWFVKQHLAENSVNDDTVSTYGYTGAANPWFVAQHQKQDQASRWVLSGSKCNTQVNWNTRLYTW